MRTIIFTSRDLDTAASLIARGEVVAFPTETVYGLGADALDPKAVRKIFRAKGRPSDNPMIVHVKSKRQAEGLAHVTAAAKVLIAKFWPGPLTIVLKKRDLIPKEVTASLDTVALRMPKSSIALKLIRLSGVPIAAPSANISGKPSGTSFDDVLADLDGRIAGIIRSDVSKIGLESTVVDVTSKIPIVLRPGAISVEQLKKVLPQVLLHSAGSMVPRSPGMKYRHYSPDAEVILFLDPRKMMPYKKAAEAMGKTVAVFRIRDPIVASRHLFRDFRECDKKKVDLILVPACSEKGIGLALMNRLRKSASKVMG